MPKPSATSRETEEPSPLLDVEESPGQRRQVVLEAFPFRIGRSPECELVFRDARISRLHARILKEGTEYFIEDAGSRNGVFVNGERVRRRRLAALDRIEFGVPGKFQLRFRPTGRHFERITEGLAPQRQETQRLARLRTLLEVARMVETSLSVDEVLAALVDAAIEFTGAERGFLFLRTRDGLELRLARHRSGVELGEQQLRVPRAVLQRALDGRRELLSMHFPAEQVRGGGLGETIAELELRSAVCVPLIRPAATTEAAQAGVPTAECTAGLLYLDSRAGEADLSGGNRELLQTLALEASIILENARLLEGERARQRMEEELRIAREIQRSLLPQALPSKGWLRAVGYSESSHQVGGDYYDLHPAGPSAWAILNADVSGKGVSSALLASVLQGVFAAWTHSAGDMVRMAEQLNRFLLERTAGEKYATLIYAILDSGGGLTYVNAGHCEPLLVRSEGGIEALPGTGLPVGLLEAASYEAASARLNPGDMLMLYTDGVTDAESAQGERFGEERLREIVAASAGRGCGAMLEALQQALQVFTEGAIQKDDVTVLILEYRPDNTP